jgi:hypothetical protein
MHTAYKRVNVHMLSTKPSGTLPHIEIQSPYDQNLMNLYDIVSFGTLGLAVWMRLYSQQTKISWSQWEAPFWPVPTAPSSMPSLKHMRAVPLVAQSWMYSSHYYRWAEWDGKSS